MVFPAQQGQRGSAANQGSVDATDRLASQIRRDQDDVLASIQVLGPDVDGFDRLFDRLVDLLIEGLFVDLRRRFALGELDRETFTEEVTALARDCRAAGLLPLRS